MSHLHSFQACIFFVLISLGLQAGENCNLKIQSMQKILRDSNFIHQKMSNCIKNIVDKKSENYFIDLFSNADGSFTYFKEFQFGVPSFSERVFENSSSSFYYLRHGKSNDRVIFSTRRFEKNNTNYKYYRKYKDDEFTLWSVKKIVDKNNSYTYFRKNRDDGKTLFSIKVLSEQGENIVYFGKKPSSPKAICSIKNGNFRDGDGQIITIGEFYKLFTSKFWTPLIEGTVNPSIDYLNLELSRY